MTIPSPDPCLQLKRQKLHHHHHRHEAEHHHDTTETHHQPLLPGLPDHIAQLCLSRVPPSTLYSVCHTWRRLLYSSSCPPFLAIYSLLVRPDEPNAVHFAAYDPVSGAWRHLPRPPQLRLLIRHPSYISRQLPVQSVAVNGKLVLIAGTDDRFMPALSSPLLFDPSTGRWAWGPQLSCPRRWCALGALGGAVYVASGIGSHYSTEVARSVERWRVGRCLQQADWATGAAPGGALLPHAPCDESFESASGARFCSNIGQEIREGAAYKNPRRTPTGAQNKAVGRKWEKMGNLKDGKFCRDAIDAVGWRGKLCMVNVEGDAAKEGAIYDAKSDTWAEMPDGMLMGWRGPATGAEEEETLYVVDESKGILKRYDQGTDSWSAVAESEKLKGARQIAAARGGKVCVLGRDGGGITVVDVAETASGTKVWGVDAPDGFQIIGIHILPRMNLFD